MAEPISLSCPRCPEAVLDVTERAGIEVDVCPICRGVWLDRGEIDRLLAGVADRAGIGTAVPGAFAPQPSPFGPEGDGQVEDNLDDLGSRNSFRDDDDDDDDDDRDDDDDDDRDERRKNRKRKSEKKRGVIYELADALEDIFDF